jgi:hypothetical protein
MWKSDGLKQNCKGVFYMQLTHLVTGEERVTMLTEEEAGAVFPNFDLRPAHGHLWRKGDGGHLVVEPCMTGCSVCSIPEAIPQ